MITIRQLKKSFRGHDALRGVDLDIPQGQVTAFLGRNGAGKTTTIKCAMNLLERDGGEVEVIGVDARRLKPGDWQKIGYVSENRLLPENLTLEQLLNWLRPMYGKGWDREFETKLQGLFELPSKTKLGALSRGQKMKAALLSALAYRPQLVVLDEPFTGLDPVVRDEFLSGLLELTDTEGWTVWVSSHDLEEVERFADRVAVLNEGKVELQEEVEALQRRFRKVELWCEEEVKLSAGMPGTWLEVRAAGRG